MAELYDDSMSAHRAVLLALLVVGSSLAVAAPAGAAPEVSAGPSDSATAGAPAVQSDPGNESANASLGADISSFMQSSAAEMSGAVETGMWSASFNATENESKRRRLVERRTGELRADLADLRERKAELEAEREAGNLSAAAYKAQVGQLIGRINALRSAINATAPRARQANTDVDAVAMLETDVRNLAGPSIASVARNSSGVGVRGPPDGVPGNDGGPPAGAGEDGAGDAGPPEDAGNGVDPGDDGALAANAIENETDLPSAGSGDGGDVPGASGGNGADGEGGPPEGTATDGVTGNGTTEPGLAPDATVAE
jgi:hypothetical protein